MSPEIPQCYRYCFRDGPYDRKHLRVSQHCNPHLAKITDNMTPEDIGGTTILTPPNIVVRDKQYFISNDNIGSLDLSYINFGQNENHVFWTMIIEFVGRSIDLQSLEINNCTNITSQMWNDLIDQLHQNQLIRLKEICVRATINLPNTNVLINLYDLERLKTLCIEKRVEWYRFENGTNIIKSN